MNPKDYKLIFQKLGDILIEKGVIDDRKLHRALKEQKETGERLGQILVKMKYITELQLMDILSEQMDIPVLNVKDGDMDISADVIKLVSDEAAMKYKIIPISANGESIKVAMVDPTDIRAVDYLKMTTGYTVDEILISKLDFEELLTKYYMEERRDLELRKIIESVSVDHLRLHDKKEEDLDIAKLKEEVEGAPIVRLVNYTIANAVIGRASDIHVEPCEDKLIVRYRIDGMLFKIHEYPKNIQMAFISRIKILAGLDIAERRLPQDGRFNVDFQKQDIDIRVSTLPTIHGEKVVLRLLKKDLSMLNMKNLGFDGRGLQVFRKYVHMPNGIILLTGPTGSGKSTTLYAALNEVSSEELNIITVEDPVEYKLNGVYQVHANPKIGLTFAAGLRSILRQDPDVIMVGEIRDIETAEMAVRASLTGHLVFSTLHTIDAASTVIRLSNMGIEPFLIASSLRMVVAQRLLRNICQKCREPYQVDKATLKRIGVKGVPGSSAFFKGKGCEHCKGSGYYGRQAIFEILEMNQEVRNMVLQGNFSGQIKAAAVKNGMITLKDKGIQKAREGVSTIEEVLRVCEEE